MNIDQSLRENYKGVFGNRVGFGKRPAILVVDFVKAYLEPSSPLYAPPVVQAVHESLTVINKARDFRFPIFFTKVILNDNAHDGGMFVRKVPVLRSFTKDSPLSNLADEFVLHPNDILVTKQYASSFFGTSLQATLTSMSVDTLILMGCSTSGCIRATAVDGMQYGFRVIIPESCVGDRAIAPHQASLFDIDSKYGDVMPTNEVLERMEEIGYETTERIANESFVQTPYS